MSLIEDYITTNNLPCLTWLDATDKTTIQSNLSTFTIANKLNNTAYDFIQADPARHPVSTLNGISFLRESYLEARNNLAFTAVTNPASFSIIAITKGEAANYQSLFEIEKTNSNKPSLVSSGSNSGKFSLSLALSDVYKPIVTSYYSNDLKIINLSHNIRLGESQISINKQPFEKFFNVSKGYVFSNIVEKLILGNNTVTIRPFIDEMQHFLLFVPAISNEHLSNLTNLLIALPENVFSFTDVFYPSFNTIVNTDSSFVFNRNKVRVFDLDAYLHFNFLLNTTFSFSLVRLVTLAYTWDNLIESEWNSLTEADWEQIETV